MTSRDTFGSADDHPMTMMNQSGGENSHSLSGVFTPFGGLGMATLSSLRDTFRGFGHQPSATMWNGLAAVAAVLEDMANGTCAPAVYVSSLDPGVGKTQLLIHYLRELLRSPDHREVAAIICVNRKEQIRSIANEAALDHFAVLTSDVELNAIATAEAKDARVLFTTQQMVEARCRRTNSFAAVSAFHFNGNPRQVRIWDEAMLPGQPLTVSLDELHTIPAELRRRHRTFTKALDEVIKQIEFADNGQRLDLPDLPRIHDLPERAALRLVTGRAALAVEKVWLLWGRTVTVRKGYGVSILDYRDTLPSDLQPVLVLDASARVRTTYDLWAKYRGGLVRLPTATKNYAGLNIGVWNRGGSKDAYTHDAVIMAEGVAKTIRSRPNEEWLIVHHKPTTEYDFQQLVLKKVTGDTTNLHFLTWGRHDATNEFAHVSNVILAGTLFKPQEVYEALGRLAAGLPSSVGDFNGIDEVKRGENAHGVLQALCRGSVRGLENGGCPISRAFIIARKGSGIPQQLSELFPGASITEWQPVPKQLKGKQEAAFEFIVDQIEAAPSRVIPFADVYHHLDISKDAFRYTRQEHKGFRAALAARGICETTEDDDQPPGYWHPCRYYFGDDDD